MGAADNGGSRVAELRKERDVTQAALARRARVSLSLLSKIEVGDRTLTPAVAAAIARALQISLDELYEETEISPEQSTVLADLRTAVRRYDIPDQAPAPDTAQLRSEVNQAVILREQADLAGLLRMLPSLVTRTTTCAHAAASQPGWALLADVYSVVYWLAARYRWMNVVEVAPPARPGPQVSNPIPWWQRSPPGTAWAPSSTAGTSPVGSPWWTGPSWPPKLRSLVRRRPSPRAFCICVA